MLRAGQVLSALDSFVRNVNNPRKAKHLLQEIGTHHFFYDAYEPHMEVFQEGFVNAMKSVLAGAEELDQATEASWNVVSVRKRRHGR